MKKILLLLAFLCFSVSLIAQSTKELDAKNGFRDHKFGDDISTFKDMVEIESGPDGLNKFYRMTGDKLSIGSSELKKISYGFYKDKFYAVSIETEGYSNSRGVLKALQELYGRGSKDNRYIEEYKWFGSKVFGVYDENSVTYDASIIFFSRTILEQQRQDEKESAKKAINDL